MCPRHQHLEPTQPLHLHPRQEWSRDVETDMLQFFSEYSWDQAPSAKVVFVRR